MGLFSAVIGRSGVGKSYRIQELCKLDPRYALRTSTSGISAVHLNGSTINSALGYFDTQGLFLKLGDKSLIGTLKKIKRDYDRLYIDECFAYEQKILTENGWKSIGSVVNGKQKINVWSKNPQSGELELKPIVRWLKNPSPESKTLLEIDASRNESLRGQRLIKVTPSHKILTPSGYIKAGELKIGDEVIVNSQGLNSIQRSIIVGSLMGDGCCHTGTRVGIYTRRKKTESIK